MLALSPKCTGQEWEFYLFCNAAVVSYCAVRHNGEKWWIQLDTTANFITPHVDSNILASKFFTCPHMYKID